MHNLKTDYLVVGAGAMGMAFVDVILNETNATVLMVDKYHQPGGHWNVAYPY
ncbi:MAG: NAD(P)-binding protein, partial [Pseudomonadales bacterium]|nr:NAD(P)-binding protein [Pseudomonadales bacterium]